MYRLSKEYVAFLKDRRMVLRLATTALKMNSADQAKVKAAARELQNAAANKLKQLNI